MNKLEEEKLKDPLAPPIEQQSQNAVANVLNPPVQPVAPIAPIEINTRPTNDYGLSAGTEAIKQGLLAEQQASKVNQDLAKEKLALLNQQQADEVVAKEQADERLAQIEAEEKRATEEYKGMKLTDPDVWGNASTGGKVLLALGALFSSASPSAAASFRSGIQNAIDRDIDRQKSEIIKKKGQVDEVKGLYARELSKTKDDQLARLNNYKFVLDAAELKAQERLASVQEPSMKAKALKELSAIQGLSQKNKEERIERMQELAIKRGTVSAQDKKELETGKEASYRYKNLKANLQQMRDMIQGNKDKQIKGSGTWELLGNDDYTKDNLIYNIALDYAKLVDPESVAREGEVAAAQKYSLPVLGLFKSNKTAIDTIDEFEKTLDKRVSSFGLIKGTDETKEKHGFKPK